MSRDRPSEHWDAANRFQELIGIATDIASILRWDGGHARPAVPEVTDGRPLHRFSTNGGALSSPARRVR